MDKIFNGSGGETLGENHHLRSLRPSQILYLEQKQQRLYVELIQILSDRNMGWLRPLCLCERLCQPLIDSPEQCPNRAEQDQVPTEPLQVTHDGITLSLQDLRQSTDLLWPLSQCQPVLDIDAIPILSALGPPPITLNETDEAHRTLRTFITSLYNESLESR